MRITFYGGAGEVTGSKHLIEVGQRRVLLDCGTFQGRRQESLSRNTGLPDSLTGVDAVVLSHAHLDHCGLLPLLVKRGYRGRIFSTSATRDIAALIMEDNLNIQQQDREYMERHRIPRAQPVEELPTADDLRATMERFVVVPYQHVSRQWTQVVSGVRLKLYEAGHILGSSVVVLEADGPAEPERVAFTGDLGRRGTPLLRDPELVRERVPTLLTESTYGGRIHRTLPEATEKLVQVIYRAAHRRGKVVVPAFALGRTQELIYVLHQLTDAGRIPSIPIFVDSPLATRITEVFRSHRDDFDAATWRDFSRPGEPPLAFRNLHYTQSVEESKQLNTKPGPFIVVAGSGMCEAGRIRHHLLNSLENPNNVVLITGFMAENTLGRKLVEGHRTVRIFGERRHVYAEVVVLNELSAHADAVGLQEYAEGIAGLRQVFLVHGEATQAAAFQARLKQQHPEWSVAIPKLGESVEAAGAASVAVGGHLTKDE